jgi:large subunit ribosomal protein L33
MAKKGTVLVKLASSAKTGYFYVIRKNPKKIGAKKLAFRKYDPIVRKHVEFLEEKLK